MNRVSVFAFSAAALTSALSMGPLGITKNAEAAWRTFHAGALCQAMRVSGSTGTAIRDSAEFGQVLNDSTTANLYLICPVTNDSAVSVAGNSSATLEVSGWSNSPTLFTGGTSMSACRTYYAGGGGQCGAGTSEAKAVNYHETSLDLSAWTAGGNNDSYYLSVTMQPKDSSGSTNTLWTYTITSP